MSGVWQGAEAEVETVRATIAISVKWWAFGAGAGMTHREGSMDAESRPCTNHHVTLQPGTEVKLGRS